MQQVGKNVAKMAIDSKISADATSALANKASTTSAHEKKIELKTAKGTRDFGPSEMQLRDRVFALIKSKFIKYGGVTIDTPVFELQDILSGKYGEDSKLIYDLADQGFYI